MRLIYLLHYESSRRCACGKPARHTLFERAGMLARTPPKALDQWCDRHLPKASAPPADLPAERWAHLLSWSTSAETIKTSLGGRSATRGRSASGASQRAKGKPGCA